MAYGRSVFPENGYDRFATLRDLPPSKIQDAQRYQTLKAKESLTNAENIELNQLVTELQNYIISPELINTVNDAITGTQKFFNENVQGFITTKQGEMNTYLDTKTNQINTYSDTKKTEVNNIVESGKVSIQSTKDSALIAIENKKDNVIDYMDGTTAGKLRNDIGIMGELTTTKNNSLVNAINEINAKEVDLTPIENSLSLHTSNLTNPHKVTAAQVGAYTKLEVNNKMGLLTDLNGEIEATNLVDAINYVYDNNKVRLSNVTSLIAQSISEGTQVRVSWEIPSSNDIQGIEVFVSSTDSSNLDYEYCNKNLTRIFNSIGTTITYNTSVNKLYYFKVFVKYDVFGAIQYSKGNNVSVLTEDKTPPNPISNFTVTKEDNGSITLSWVNPTNTDFVKTKILYKTTNYPTSPSDGTIAYDSSGTTATITGLSNDTKYYFSAYTYDQNGNMNTSSTQRTTGTPSAVKVYGVRIDKANSNPETSVTYTDNAVGMTGGSSSWDNLYPFNTIKPCLFKNGAVNYYLNPNDFSKKADGTASDISSGTDGDVMIEFPKVWWKITSDTSQVLVKYADKQIDATWKPLAHTKGITEKDKIYVGAYLGYNLSSKLRSLSGKTPSVNQTIDSFRTMAQGNGTGYQQIGYFQLMMLQILYLIRYKSLDSQTKLGRGFVDGNSASIATGGTNAKGMNFGESTGKQQMKFAGIEDFWGNCYYWIDGLFCASNRNILIGTQNFSDSGNGYVNYGQGATVNISGYINDIQGATETGFIVKTSTGSSTTYYSDYGYLDASCLPLFGGSWSDASDAGAFRLYLSLSASNSYSNVAARLAFV